VIQKQNNGQKMPFYFKEIRNVLKNIFPAVRRGFPFDKIIFCQDVPELSQSRK
jgi:hypothetical protein